MVAIPIRVDERRFYVGKTGSGKSFLARHDLGFVASAHWPILIIDSPDHHWYDQTESEMPGKRATGTVDAPRFIGNGKLYNPSRVAVQLYQPETPGYDDPYLLALLDEAYHQQNMLVYFDELYGIVTNTRQPEEMIKLWAQGRKINVGTWASVQRPTRIPELVMSQSEHMFVFRLPGQRDRDRMAEYTGDPRLRDKAIPMRHFWYWGQEMDHAVYCLPIRDEAA